MVSLKCPLSQCGALLREVLIRVDAVGMSTQPLDMHAGSETTLARVVQAFGAARPHHDYLFNNERVNRMKVLVHDGFGIRLAARRLNQGKFAWGDERLGPCLILSAEQLQLLVTGFPWQRLGDGAVITVL